MKSPGSIGYGRKLLHFTASVSNKTMGFTKLTSARSLAFFGTLLLCGGIGWWAVLKHGLRDAPDWLKYEWTPPPILRVMVLVGLMLLIWAGATTLYKFLWRRSRN